jgi:hypothetical protein
MSGMGGLNLGPKRYFTMKIPSYLKFSNFKSAIQSNCGKPLKIDTLRIYSNINLAQNKDCGIVTDINIYRQSATKENNFVIVLIWKNYDKQVLSSRFFKSHYEIVSNAQRLNVCRLKYDFSFFGLRYSLVPKIKVLNFYLTMFGEQSSPDFFEILKKAKFFWQIIFARTRRDKMTMTFYFKYGESQGINVLIPTKNINFNCSLFINYI